MCLADGMETPEGVRSGAKFYRFHYAMDEKNVRDPRPVDEHCNCELCKNHSRAYLHHLFRVNDPQAMHLATAHNLRFFGRLMQLLQEK